MKNLIGASGGGAGLFFTPVNEPTTLGQGGLFFTDTLTETLIVNCSALGIGAYVRWLNLSPKPVILNGFSTINGVSIPSGKGINIAAGGNLEGFVSVEGNFKSLSGAYTITFLNPPTDPLSAMVVAYLKGEAIADNSPTTKQITNSGVSLSSVRRKYRDTSLYFNGASNLIINLAGAGFNLATGVGCIECWAYINNYFTFASAGASFVDFYWQYYYYNYLGDGNSNIIAWENSPQNQWVHFALTFSSNTWKWYQNGILKHSVSGLKSYNVNSIKIGGRDNNDSLGYLNEWRLTVGNIRYTGNFDCNNQEEVTYLGL